MPRMSSLVSSSRIPPGARRALRKVRTATRLATADPARFTQRLRQRTHPATRKVTSAARLAKDEPTELVRRVRRRVTGGSRRAALATAPRRASKVPPLRLSAPFPAAAERGYLVLERHRGFDEKDYVVTATVTDEQGRGLKPGRAWRYSQSLGGYYTYPTADETATVTLPFTATGTGATRLDVAVHRWNARALPPAEAFGSAWALYAQTRDAGADPTRLHLVPALGRTE